MNLDTLTNLEPLYAERALIGSILLDNRVMDDVVTLKATDFTQLAHELIWKSFVHLYNKQEPIDAVTLMSLLNRGNKLNDAGGVEYISQLSNSVPDASHAKYYAEEIHGAAYRRRILLVASKLIETANDADIDDPHGEVEKLFADLQPETQGGLVSIADARKEYFDFLSQSDDLIPTGFKRFDEWMGGVGRGWLWIMAGRPSVGKTAKALQMARGMAEQGKGDVLFWSQEMKRTSLLSRMISGESRVNSTKIRRKELNFTDNLHIKEAYDRLEQLPMRIFDAKNVTIEEIRAEARQFKRRYGKIGAIFVDYLTIMKINQRKGETRSQAVGYVTRTAKQISQELDCPFIMLAQLSRDGAGKPEMQHLRDSGEIEQDADVIELLWQNPDDVDGGGKVITGDIVKGRDVGVNSFKYLFKGWLQQYDEYSIQDQ